MRDCEIPNLDSLELSAFTIDPPYLWVLYPWMQSKIFRKRQIPESSKKQHLNLPCTGNYLRSIYIDLHSIYIVVGFISNLGKILKYVGGTDLENEFMVVGGQGEGWGERVVTEFGVDMFTQLYLKWITTKDLLNSIWSSAQCYVAAWMGGELGGE